MTENLRHPRTTRSDHKGFVAVTALEDYRFVADQIPHLLRDLGEELCEVEGVVMEYKCSGVQLGNFQKLGDPSNQAAGPPGDLRHGIGQLGGQRAEHLLP